MKRAVMVAAVALAIGGTLLAFWALQQDPAELSAWWASSAPPPAPRTGSPYQAPPTPPIPPPPPVQPPQPTPTPTPQPPLPPRECKAMTWGVRGQSGLTTWVGAIDNSTNPYGGDTPCSETRPLLCFQPGTRPQPAAFNFPTLIPRIRWTGGAFALVPEVLGLEIRSREVADRMCTAKFGEGWRMAEFHDGGGWGFGAEGELPKDARFWVAINDQRANLWDR